MRDVTKYRKARADRGSITFKSRILVVDDHPLVRAWLSWFINGQDDLMVCGEVADRRYAIDAYEELKPDLVIVDISLAGGWPGIELIKDLKARDPCVRALVLSMHNELFYAERLLAAGALGYVNKQMTPEAILRAIHKVLAGLVYVSDAVGAVLLNKLFHAPAATAATLVDLLTEREIEIFELIGHGSCAREIADQLHIGVKTVESYKMRIKEKLGLEHAQQVLKHAVRWVLAAGGRYDLMETASEKPIAHFASGVRSCPERNRSRSPSKTKR